MKLSRFLFNISLTAHAKNLLFRSLYVKSSCRQERQLTGLALHSESVLLFFKSTFSRKLEYRKILNASERRFVVANWRRPFQSFTSGCACMFRLLVLPPLRSEEFIAPGGHFTGSSVNDYEGKTVSSYTHMVL